LRTIWVFTALLILASNVEAIQIVAEKGDGLVCQEFQFAKGLRVYRDPALFLGSPSLITSEPEMAWELMRDERPILTTLTGKRGLVLLGKPRPFRNFGDISRVFEAADPDLRVAGEKESSPMIVPVRICGEHEAYNDSLGFVLASELVSAQVDERTEGSMRPSTVGNQIPALGEMLGRK